MPRRAADRPGKLSPVRLESCDPTLPFDELRALDLEACLQRHPNGVFVELARLRIEELETAGAAGKATRALVTTKNVIIPLGAMAIAGTALFTFGDRFLVRRQSWGW